MNGPKFNFVKIEKLQYFSAVFEVSREAVKRKAKKDIICSFSRTR